MYTVISSIVLIIIFLFLVVLVIKDTLAKHKRKIMGEPPEPEPTVQEDLLRGIAGDVPKADTMSDEGKSFMERVYSGKSPQGKRGRYLAGNEKSRIKEMVEKEDNKPEI